MVIEPTAKVYQATRRGGVRGVGMWLTALLLCGCPPKNDILRQLDPKLPDAAATGGSDTSRRAVVRGRYLAAAVATERGDFEQALHELEWVRRLEEAGSPWPHVALGRLHERTGDWQAAIAAYELAIELDDDCAEAHLGLGRVMLGRGVAVAAVHHLQRAEQLAPTAEGYELMVRASLATDELEGAHAALAGWVRVSELSRDEGLRQARMARDVGCGALDVVQRLETRWRGSPDVLRVAAAAYEDCEQAEKAALLRQRAQALEGPS